MKTSSYMGEGDVFTIHLSCSVPSEHHRDTESRRSETESGTESGTGDNPDWQPIYSYNYGQVGQEYLYGTDDNQV